MARNDVEAIAKHASGVPPLRCALPRDSRVCGTSGHSYALGRRFSLIPESPGMRKETPMTTILIRNGIVLTLAENSAPLPGHDILVRDGKISGIEPNIDAGAADEVIDADGMIVMPGLVNAHIHTWQNRPARPRAGLDRNELFPGDARGARRFLHPAGHPHRQPCWGPQSAQLRRDHHGGLAPQQSDAGPFRRRDRRVGGCGHPGDVPAWLRQARPQARAETFLRDPDVAVGGGTSEDRTPLRR